MLVASAFYSYVLELKIYTTPLTSGLPSYMKPLEEFTRVFKTVKASVLPEVVFRITMLLGHIIFG